MTITGPINLLNLTDRELTNSVIYSFKECVWDLKNQNIYSPDVLLIENYLKQEYGLKTTIYDILLELVYHIEVSTNNNNEIIVIINKHMLKSINLTCDQLTRLISYGNQSVKGTDLIEIIFNYVFRHF